MPHPRVPCTVRESSGDTRCRRVQVAKWYEMLLAYQQKPAPSVTQFGAALENLATDPVITPHIAELKL